MNQSATVPSISAPTSAHTSIAGQLVSAFFSVQLRGSAPSLSAPYDAGRDILAREEQGARAAFRASKKLFPKGFDAEVRAVQKSYAAVRSNFNAATVAYTVTDRGREDGPRLLATADHWSGRVLRRYEQDLQALADARAVLVAVYPDLVDRIGRSGVLGHSFNRADYPTIDDIRDGWRYVLDGPTPLPDVSSLQSMRIPLSPQMIGTLSARVEAQAERRLATAQQQLAKRTMEALQRMLESLSKLREYQDSGTTHNLPGDGKKRRQPAIFASLFSSLTHQADLLSAYALEGTKDGDRMRDLSRAIRKLGEFTPDFVKASADAADAAVQAAKSALQDVEDLGFM